MKSRAVGFSLLECMLTMALLLLVLGVGGDLMMRYSDQMRFAAVQENALESVQVGLGQVGGEVREAIGMTRPAVGTPSSDLLYEIYDPTLDWLPTVGPSATATEATTPGVASLFPSSGCLTVHVSLSTTNSLQRTVTSASGLGATTTANLADGIEAVHCSVDAGGLVRIELDLEGRAPVVHTVLRTVQ